jgi:hypothetical protein
VERQCRQAPRRVLADSGFFSRENVEQLEERGWDGYVPDSNLARELNGLGEAKGIGNRAVQHAGIQRMRHKLRSPAGRQQYGRRKQLVEPVIGSLKEHGGMRAFQRRGLRNVAMEWALAAMAFNLKRWQRVRTG